MPTQLDPPTSSLIKFHFLHEEISSKKRAIEVISQLASAELSIPTTEIFQLLIERERFGCTAVGHGIAIPHAVLPYAFETQLICLKPQKSIDFGARDGQPVNLILALLFSDIHIDNDIMQLKEIATRLSDKEQVKKLDIIEDENTAYLTLQALFPTLLLV